MGRITQAWNLVTKGLVPGSDLVVSEGASGRPVAYYDAFDLARHSNEVVSIAREWLAQQAAEPALVAWTDGAPDYSHPLSLALARPSGADNAHLTQSDVWRFVTRQLGGPTRVGCFLLVVKDAAGRVSAVWPRSDKEVRPVKDRREFVSHYEWRDGTSWKRVPEGIEVIWLRLVGDDLYSHHSPLHDVTRSIRTDAEAAKWLDYLLQNMGAPGGLLAIDGIDRSTAEQVRDFINMNVMGANNAGKVEVTGGKADLIEFSSKLADVDFGPLKDRLELAIASAYGIPAELLQLLVTAKQGEGLSGNAFREKRKIAYNNRVIPWLRVIEERVGLVVGPMYGLDPNDVRFDLAGIDALEDSPLEKAQELSAVMQSFRTIASVNERRALCTSYGFALDKVSKEGDEIPEIANRARLAAFSSSLTLSSTGPTETKAAAPDPFEVRFAAAAERVFASEKRRAVAIMAALPKSGELEAAAKRLADAVDESEWEDAFTDLVRLALAEAGGSIADGFGVTFDLTNPRVTAAVQQRVTELAGQVSDTTRQSIRDLVAEKVANGETLADLARDIASTDVGPWGSMTVDVRSRLIARTEVHGARMQGQYEGAVYAAGDVGPLSKTWVTAGDELVRDEHAALEGETVGIDEPFSNGLMYPSEPNCRCDVIYATVKE